MALGRIVAAVSGVGQNAGELVTDRLLDIGDDGLEGVAIIRVAWQCHGVQGELAALGAVQCRVLVMGWPALPRTSSMMSRH